MDDTSRHGTSLAPAAAAGSGASQSALRGRALGGLLIVVLAAILTGGGCRYLRPPTETYTGPELPPSPTLDQVAQFVNNNARQIHSFTADQASLSGPGFPTLRARVVFQRPRRLRILGETSLTGLELDVGSNDEVFWFWVRRNEPPAMYYCRHEDFQTSAARQVVPIDPDYLIDALGLAEIDPAAVTSGPVALSGGRLEIRSAVPSPEGTMTQVTILDAKYGLILGQHLYDPRGQLVASAQNLGHRRDPLTGLVMPRAVQIRVPRTDLSLRVDLGQVRINQVIGDPSHLWSMPQYQGYPVVNLADPRLQAIPASVQTGRLPRPPSGVNRVW